MQALEITNLIKTYKNGFEALKGVGLSVKEGAFFALLGPNGAGKSTTIGIITGLVNKTGGRVNVFGLDSDQHAEQVKNYIGLVPQEFNFNVFEPVEEIIVNQAGYYGINRKEAFIRSEKYLKELDLWDKRRVMARELSGGMKRRLMMARALVHHPKLLILDEPSAGVDVEIRRSMWAYLREINSQGTTIILTTHYLEEAEDLCDEIAIIDQGVTIEHTSMKELLSRLKKETLILYFKEHRQTVPIDIEGYNIIQVDDKTLEVELYQGQSMHQLLKTLCDYGIEVISMRNKNNRLEQLFMGLVEMRSMNE